MGLSISFFAALALFGSLDYGTIFNISPFMNENAITIITLLLFSGAMAKSAQIPLHSWLPGSMEGLKFYNTFYILLYFYFLSNSSYFYELHSAILPIFQTVSKQTLYTITGNMLGDGSINRGRGKGAGKYSMTMDAYSLNYLTHLYQKIYGQYSGTKIKGYPNLSLTQHKDKQITQYQFSTRTHLLFTALHDIWYKWDEEKNKFIKIVPLNISEMFSEISLAY